ncbi:MAG: hypothetical protein UH685_06085 [Bacteroidaceae bacterium]|nr:hypothetical protein [Bacteroidaceae bacterium]
MDKFPGELQKQFVVRPYTSPKGRACTVRCLSVVLTDEQRDWLVRWFPVTENARLKKASGMKDATLHRFAREYGLAKSQKGMHAIRVRQAAKTKKACAKNGYYDSLRGRRPSDACIEASRIMWQEIKSGKRTSPHEKLKQRPSRYRKMCAQMSENRKELIRKERQRAFYGLKRKTQLTCVVLQRYTRSQVSARYNALKKGYLVAADRSDEGGMRYDIYYDENTKRTDRFEKNLKALGFTIKEW